MKSWGEMAINYEWVLTEWDRFLKMSERIKTQDATGYRPIYSFAASDDEVRQQFSVALLALETIFPGIDFGLPDPDRSLAIRVKVMREIVHDAIPQVKRKDEIAANLKGDDNSPIIAADSLHPWVWSAAKPHWESGNHRAALLAAATNVNSRLRRKLGRKDVSDQKAIQQAFTPEPAEPDRPRLRLVGTEDPDNFKSVQIGVMNFGCGLFGAVRNPVAHLADDDHDVGEREALESLAAFSLFARWIDRASVEHAPPGMGPG